MKERALSAIKLFCIVVVVRMCISLLAERLLFIQMPLQIHLVLSIVLGFIAAPLAMIPAWSFARKVICSLLILLAVEATFLLVVVAMSKGRGGNVSSYLEWIAVDVASTVVSWFLLRVVDKTLLPHSEPVAEVGDGETHAR